MRSVSGSDSGNKSRIFRWSIRLGAIVLAGGVAYFGGKSVARGAQERNSLDALRLSQQASDEKLERMGGTLKRSMILPTQSLYDLEGEPIELTPLARNGLLLTYIDPSCFSCISQGKEMAEVLKSQPERAVECVVISYNRAALEEWRDYFEVDCIFVLDSTAELSNSFN